MVYDIMTTDPLPAELWAEAVRSIEAKNAEIRALHRANRTLRDALRAELMKGRTVADMRFRGAA